MTKYTKILEGSIKNLRSTLTGISLDQFVASTVDTLMLIERQEYLQKAVKDKANGYYSRAFKSLQRHSLLVNVPRTRTGAFKPSTIELIKINQDYVDELCLTLYKKGVTTRDVSDILENMFGESVSHTTVSELANVFNQFREAWNNSKLEKTYKIVYADVIFITVKRGRSYSKEGVFVAYGVKEDNTRELLVLDINPTESAYYWGELIQNLKQRGVSSIGLFVADGLVGLEDEIHKHYPKAEFQKCVVHKQRNVLSKTRTKDKREMADDLKELFNNFDKDSSIEKAENKLENFLTKWKKKYPRIENQFKEGNIEYYFTYIKYNPEVRRLIYTTNGIEGMNRVIRKATKNKLSFEQPERLLDYVFMVIKDFEERVWKYPIYQFEFFEKFQKNLNQTQFI
jgi:transposase-like protein